MKLFSVAAAIVAALTLSSLAVAGGTLAGKYSTKIASPPLFKGTWVLNLMKSGAYTVADNGHVVVHGTYTATAKKITFGHETGPAACPKSATYTWQRSGKTLKFTKVNEVAACSGRAGVLSHTFTVV